MAKVLASVGCMLFIILIVGAYFPLSEKMATPDFQAWRYGPMFSALLPVFLTGFGVLYVCVLARIQLGGSRGN